MGLEINEEEGIFKVGCFSKIFLRRKVFKGIFNENDEKGDNNENDDCNDSILRVLFFRRKDFQRNVSGGRASSGEVDPVGRKQACN